MNPEPPNTVTRRFVTKGVSAMSDPLDAFCKKRPFLHRRSGRLCIGAQALGPRSMRPFGAPCGLWRWPSSTACFILEERGSGGGENGRPYRSDERKLRAFQGSADRPADPYAQSRAAAR